MTFFHRHDTVREPHGVTLTSGDVRGVVDVEQPGAVAGVVDTVLAAAERLGMRRRLDVRLNGLEGPGDPSDMAKLKVTLDRPADHRRRVVLESDASGLLRWHLPQVEPHENEDRPTFVVPVRPAEFATPGGAVRHGVHKVLHVLSVATGATPEFSARTWERQFRPYRLRWVDGSLTEVPAPAVNGPVLLLVHGTFATTESTFAGLASGTLETLAERYGGRVLVLDHPTMADTPAENVDWLLRALPDRVREVDLLCHSRGGLVGRELAARAAGRLEVRTMIHVGTPNGGTPLVDPSRPTRLVDVLTNLVRLGPEPAADVLDSLIAAVEHLAVHSLHSLDGLPGLTAMRPGNPWLTALNSVERAGPPVVHAIASDYEPPAAAEARMRAFDLIEDAIFGDAGNDLVVPMSGVYSAGRYVVENYLTFAPDEGVTHFGYFFHPRVRDLLLATLATADPSVPAARGAAHVDARG